MDNLPLLDGHIHDAHGHYYLDPILDKSFLRIPAIVETLAGIVSTTTKFGAALRSNTVQTDLDDIEQVL